MLVNKEALSAKINNQENENSKSSVPSPGVPFLSSLTFSSIQLATEALKTQSSDGV